MLKIAIIASVAGLILSQLATAASAETRYDNHRRYVRHTYRHACIRHKANNGTVIGAVAGGVLGNIVGGHGAGGTIIGAGAGAVAGHQIAKNNARSSC